MYETTAQTDDLTALLFADELEERLEMALCFCTTWNCDGDGPYRGCWNCFGFRCVILTVPQQFVEAEP